MGIEQLPILAAITWEVYFSSHFYLPFQIYSSHLNSQSSYGTEKET